MPAQKNWRQSTISYAVFSTCTAFFAASAFSPVPALAHDEEHHCGAIADSVAEAGFAGDVSVTCDAGRAIIVSDTYPDHPLMTGIVGTNEQIPVPAKDYAAPIPLTPVLGDTPQTRDAALGVAVNGVPIFDYTGGGEMRLEDLRHHQTQHDTLLTQQLDICGGHAGRGDDYHYHVKPVCMIEQMANAGDDAIIGWAFDGFPIYGDNNPDGTPIATEALGVCNGQPDDTFGYRYHTSANAPYIVQCLMGEVANWRDLPRVSPLKSASSWWGGGRESGRPPRRGVQGPRLLRRQGDRCALDGIHLSGRGLLYALRADRNARLLCVRNTDRNQQWRTRDWGILSMNAAHLPFVVLASAALIAGCDDRPKPPGNGRVSLNERVIEGGEGTQIRAEIWVDNWFSMAINGQPLIEDSVAYKTERSFNAERVTFRAELPMTVAFEFRDFMENDTGLEYIGSNRQQIGDGGAIAQFTNVDTGAVIAVTDARWRCLVIHHAPVSADCADEDQPIVGEGSCAARIDDAPEGWRDRDFDDADWTAATVHSTREVRPKDGYDEIEWDSHAELIWSDDLKLDNIVLCRTRIDAY